MERPGLSLEERASRRLQLPLEFRWLELAFIRRAAQI
jgi:hypothetical protein